MYFLKNKISKVGICVFFFLTERAFNLKNNGDFIFIVRLKLAKLFKKGDIFLFLDIYYVKFTL